LKFNLAGSWLAQENDTAVKKIGNYTEIKGE